MPRKNYGPKLVKRGRIFYAEYFDRERGYTTRVSLGTEDREEAEDKFAEVGIAATNPVRRSLKSINVDFLVAKYYTEVAKEFPSRYTYNLGMSIGINHLHSLVCYSRASRFKGLQNGRDNTETGERQMKSTCRGCGRTFGGLVGFERHRYGEYNHSPPNYGRYCRGDEELRDMGLAQDASGAWRGAAPAFTPKATLQE